MRILPTGLALQCNSIFKEIKAGSLKQDISPATISMGLVRRLNSLLRRSTMLVVLRETQCSSGKWKKVRQDLRDRSKQATAEGT